MPKDIIYIGDLSYKEDGTPFPLGAGYIASMVDYYYNNNFETVIFTNPLELTEAIKKNTPKIVALANYSWNNNINCEVLKFTKNISNKIITVLGGPFFAKNDKIWLKDFFNNNKALDFYVSGEGEWKFIQVVKQSQENSYEVDRISNKLSPDIFFRNKNGDVTQGTVPLQEELDNRYKDTRKKHLDTIKSPYLTGRLDKFFKIDGMVPMIETVRGCPYGCTFCCWGDPSLSRLTAFSEERVYSELDYIAQRSKSSRLIMADGNFGILKRDILIANHLYSLNQKYNWPKNIYLYFAKNSNDNVVKVASVLGKMIKVSLARQTMNQDVLKNIKRKNINDETFYRVQKELAASNIDSSVEFIYPLPGETRKTFVDGIDDLFKKLDILHTEMRFYQTELLPGSEMATTDHRQKFGIKTAWRKLWRASKDFGNVKGCEYQEIITSTNTFSFSDLVYVRMLHYFVCLFSTYKIYTPVVELYQKKMHKNSFIWFIDRLISEMENDKNLMKELSDIITSEVKDEFIPINEYHNGKSTFPNQKGSAKRINIYYILTLLYGKQGKYREAFTKLIKDVFVKNSLGGEEEINKILNQINANIIDYNNVHNLYMKTKSQNDLSTQLNDVLSSEYAKCQNGDLLETLYKMYDLSSAGLLQMMVLKKHNRTVEKKEKINKATSQIEASL